MTLMQEANDLDLTLKTHASVAASLENRESEQSSLVQRVAGNLSWFRAYGRSLQKIVDYKGLNIILSLLWDFCIWKDSLYIEMRLCSQWRSQHKDAILPAEECLWIYFIMGIPIPGETVPILRWDPRLSTIFLQHLCNFFQKGCKILRRVEYWKSISPSSY